MKVRLEQTTLPDRVVPIISISHHSHEDYGPAVYLTAGDGYWEVHLMRIRPQELIDALLTEVERLESEAIDAISTSGHGYSSEQENLDREKYLEQKYG